MNQQAGNVLCSMLASALHQQNTTKEYVPDCEKQVRELADKHKVLPLLYDFWNREENIGKLCRQTVSQSYHLLFLGKYIVNLLEEQQIESILLKGSSTAEFYPVPELRKSGDVDLLLRDEQAVTAACKCLKLHGFVQKEEQMAQHHVVCISPDQISVELHSSLTEPFDDPKINRLLVTQQKEFFRFRIWKPLMGVKLPVLGMPYHAYYLLLHMLQHFLRAGFGIKLLCDWVCLWEHGCTKEEREIFLRLVRESRIEQFAVMVTALCVRKLALSPEKVEFWAKEIHQISKADMDEFFAEILEAEEFGRSDESRMVVMRGTRLGDYIREFHHQTMLTYPRAGKFPPAFPVLWVMMLAGFCYRNKHLRGISGREVLKKAKKRSKLVEKMKLFV